MGGYRDGLVRRLAAVEGAVPGLGGGVMPGVVALFSVPVGGRMRGVAAQLVAVWRS